MKNPNAFIEKMRIYCPNKTESFSFSIPQGNSQIDFDMQVSIEDDEDLILDLNYESIESYYSIIVSSRSNHDNSRTELAALYLDQFFNILRSEKDSVAAELSEVLQDLTDLFNLADDHYQKTKRIAL